jgi:2-polyprenyl-6-methoxyphenol hydroxylase-like FAD-dependent oxidoreductase
VLLLCIYLQVLVGCDGINSVVAKWLGLATPSYSGRSAARGFAHYPDGHGFDPKFLQFIGNGFRSGMLPCNDNDVYWFFTWTPSENGELLASHILIHGDAATTML